MTYKAGVLVYFDGAGHKGVGIVSRHVSLMKQYLVHSTQIANGHDGMSDVYKQDSWWFREDDLKPFTKKVGQKYIVISNDCNSFEIGDIATLTKIDGEGVSLYENEEEVEFLYDLDHHKCEVEFYADVEDVKEHKENEMFTKNDLKVGYLVKIRDGRFAHVVDTDEKGMCLNFVNGWNTLRNYNNDLTHITAHLKTIIEVYGYTRYGINAHKFEVGDRTLLWKREKIKEMTIEDIQKALGHKIKVVE